MDFKIKMRRAVNNSKVKMERIDNKEIPDDKEEVRLFVIGIDSDYLLPHFLKHYFDISVDRVFYIDNNSSDNSLEILKKYDRVHVWLQKEEFCSRQSKGRKWREFLLYKYGMGHWCLAHDMDELFIYPDYENKSIREFTKEQDDAGYDCVRARCIDMYSDKKVEDTVLKGSLIETCSYFDRSLYGCRYRVLDHKPFFMRSPLFRYSENIFESTGTHDIFGYKKTSNVLCGFLHFKFISNFILWNDKHHVQLGCKIRCPKKRSELYDGLGDINFYNEEVSIKYSGSEILDIFKNMK